MVALETTESDMNAGQIGEDPELIHRPMTRTHSTLVSRLVAILIATTVAYFAM